MINDLPTIFEVVTGNVKQPKEQSGTQNNSSKSKASGKVGIKKVASLIFHTLYYFFNHLILYALMLSSPGNPSPSPRELRCLHRQKMKMKVVRKKKKMMNRVQHVGLVGITMVPTSSGFAVMCVRDGSMENV